MPTERTSGAQRGAELLDLVADVLVIGGGPAGAWAALTATEAGARVILVDKGYLGTSGATAPSNTGTWFVPPGEGRARRNRAAAVAHRRTGRSALGRSHARHGMAAAAHARRLGLYVPQRRRGQAVPRQSARPRLHALHAAARACAPASRFSTTIRRSSCSATPASIAGAAGIDRQRNRPWRVRAGAVVLATGGCAFGERMLGATG